ncbi:MAG: response regulator [Candidatus Terrybacteria bacterium]|nr:response regulator [Candidatus Terrybacteria bacterium]
MSHILIVDDEECLVDMLKIVLRGDGHETASAAGGEEAIMMLGLDGDIPAIVSPDLVILDLFMPRVDGYEVYSLLRGSAKLGLTPVIVLTSIRKWDLRVPVDRIREQTAFMQKPFDPAVLRRQVRDMLAVRANEVNNGLPGGKAQALDPDEELRWTMR